jgi:hypothetical protein
MAISFNNLRNLSDSGLNYRFYTVTGGVFSSIKALSNVDLWADTGMVVNDYQTWACFGQANKPRGMRFHVSTAIVAVGYTAVWEYRKTDGTWAAFAGVTDATNGFTTAGTNLDVTWTVPTDWGSNSTSVNGNTGLLFWRLRVSALTSYTEGGRLGNTTPSTTQIYDNAIRVEDNHDYSSGTATSGANTTLTDSGKAWTVDALRNRIVYIHTGTGAGQNRVILSNTATSMTVHHGWLTNPDSTSQYRVCANFEDIYQADLAGGWGVVTRAGEHSFSFDCFLDIRAAAFGEVQTNIEFQRNYMFYCPVAHTNAYQLHFGWRPLLVYGLDKGLLGNNFVFIKDTVVDERGSGFSTASDYVFTAGNRYVQRFEYLYSSTDAFLRRWFYHRGKWSINETYEGWRSLVFDKTSPSRTEVRNIEATYGHSGLEQPQASFSKILSYYHASLAIFPSSGSNYNFDNFELGLNNYIGSSTIYGSPIQFFAYTGTATKYKSLKPRIRPMTDVYSTGSTGRSQPQYAIRTFITDEKNNPIQNAKMVITDSLASNKFNVLSFDGNGSNDDVLTVPNNSASNQFFGSTSFSFEANIYAVTTGGSALGRVFEKGQNGVDGYGLSLSGGSLVAYVFTNGVNRTSNTISLPLGSWHHAVGVWDGSTIKLYLDTATAAGNNAAGAASNDTARTLYIGSSVTASRTWGGFIRRVRLYRNVALSASDVATLWNGGDFMQDVASPIAGCTAEYNFTEGSGTTVADTSGNAATATLGSASTAPTWYSNNTSLSSTTDTLTTGIASEFLASTNVVSGGTYSLTTQPTAGTKLRFTVTNFVDFFNSSSGNARIQLSGTDQDNNAIQEVFFLKEIGNSIYTTTQEFKTIDTLGISVTGWNGTITIDRAGRTYPVYRDIESWNTPNDVSLLTANYNPLTFKISAPGFEPETIVKNVYEDQDWHVCLKRSSLDLT